MTRSDATLLMTNRTDMKRISVFLCGLCLLLNACNVEKPTNFSTEKLVAWCIVPFDAAERSPEERAAMLKELGITRLAYDYRDRHIPEFAREIEVLKQEGIELSALWLWIDMRDGQVMGEASKAILDILEESGTKTELWLGFAEGLFHGSQEENLEAAVGMVGEVKARAEGIGCTVALYNHGGWFGDPVNQVEIIEAMEGGDIKIVYNFHHAHHQLDRFPQLLDQMLPHLSTINLNGMRPEGPKILPLGGGSHEKEMIRTIMDAGYEGQIGILGHTEGLDIKPVLQKNLEGLEQLLNELTE